MRADRRVDAARPVELAAADHLLVERFAHAVQALEFVLAAIEIGAGEDERGSQSLRIVGGELRIDGVGRREQFAGAGEVADVGVDLAGEHRKAVEAVELRALDLRIPIGALDEANHEAPARAASEVDQPVDDRRASFAIGLDDEAEPVPAFELRVERQRLEKIEREIEPVGFLGVDVEADVIRFGERRERLHARQKFVHHARALDALIARMERRKLDGDSRSLVDAATMRGSSDGVNGAFVFVEIARRVLRCRRRFAEHVVGERKSARLALTGVADRLLDRAAGHELLAHEAHGDVDAGPDDRLAAARDEAGQRRRETLLAGRRHQLSGQHQAPGGRVDEQRGAHAEMRAPVAGRELVADQRVARRGVGDAQKRFREAHQRHPLLARERIFVDEALDPARARLRPELGDQAGCDRPDAARVVRACGRELNERRHALGLRKPISRGDRASQRRLRQDLGAERGEDVGGGGHVRLRASKGDPGDLILAGGVLPMSSNVGGGPAISRLFVRAYCGRPLDSERRPECED